MSKSAGYMVHPMGLEPICLKRQIFLLLYVTIATFLCCSLDYVFTLPFGLGSGYIVSTHLPFGFSSALSCVTKTFAELAHLHLQCFHYNALVLQKSAVYAYSTTDARMPN